MRLLVLETSAWTVTAVQEMTQAGEYECPFVSSLEELGPNYTKSMEGLMSMLEKFAAHGQRMLNDEICHEADKNAKIFEFIKGDLRLLWFYGDGNKIIVCSHAFVKKRQKAPPLEVRKAINLKDRYEKLIKDGKKIELFFEEE
ncbi:type II toxin-antitoxin system RelE/ParE family toxin [Bowmanella yangjiangensis]|uniref:Type II toxin-antitoxin system RelE/ParE family toxin n=1 Tax=Bowmanella yangjiangensis TaxID=2811230 RepID=A0ABS3D1T1_9ALTE|nr:type II toxin-antitoxin system RelE/ParE family toxin [Bowmanella yangjiangensis]MBN7822316.1 type II toxin-antitoxin system RelE/ParE family toxin [Bowmanella yangjiangensis]